MLIITFFMRVMASIPSLPSSEPTPEALKPAYGALGNTKLCRLNQTVPAWILLASWWAWQRLVVQMLAASPYFLLARIQCPVFFTGWDIDRIPGDNIKLFIFNTHPAFALGYRIGFLTTVAVTLHLFAGRNNGDRQSDV